MNKTSGWTVQIRFAGEWVSVGGSIRIPREDAIAQAAYMRSHGDEIRVVTPSGELANF